MTRNEPIIKRISLDLIKSSPYQDYVHPEKDIAEAAISIKSKGVLEKPRGYYDNYLFYLIFGHKRVEAARKAGQTYIFCYVVEKPDILDILCQQIIEDEQHKEKPWEYRAERYFRALQEMGEIKTSDGREIWGEAGGAEVLHQLTGVPENTIVMAIKNLASRKRLEQYSALSIAQPNGTIKPVSQRIIQHASAGAPDDDKAAALAIQKAISENIYDRKVIRNIAKAIAETDDQDRIDSIMETPVTNPNFDKLVKAKTFVKKATKRRQAKKGEKPREVKDFLDAATKYRDSMKTWLAALADAAVAVEFGMWSPESAQYFIEKHRTDHADLHDRIEKVESTFLNVLSNVNLLKELQDGEVEPASD